MPTTKQIATSLVVCPIIGTLIAIGGSVHHGQQIEIFAGGLTVPIFGICVWTSFVINWIAFVPAYVLQTEKFFDIMGSLTYIIGTTMAVTLSTQVDERSYLLASMVILWATRLGIFLTTRIMRDGKDQRFDEIKPNFLRFWNVWTLQGLWVTFTSAAALIAITTTQKVDLDIFAIVGFIIWLIGFGIEIVADHQKSSFRNDPANKSQFISTGLWSKSRHPNYFGEIVLWMGVAFVTLPTLQGWSQWMIALCSPIFVTLLITRVSGIPLLEAKADKKWAGETNYEHYKTNTPVLIPKLF